MCDKAGKWLPRHLINQYQLAYFEFKAIKAMKEEPFFREGKIGRIGDLLTSSTNINTCTLREAAGQLPFLKIWSIGYISRLILSIF